MSWADFFSRGRTRGFWVSPQVLVWFDHEPPSGLSPAFTLTEVIHVIGFFDLGSAEAARKKLGAVAPDHATRALLEKHPEKLHQALPLCREALQWDLSPTARLSLAEGLRELRDLVRAPLPSPLVCGLPMVCIDVMARADARRCYVRGWWRNCRGKVQRLTAHSPEGFSLELLAHIFVAPRIDIHPLFPSDTYSGFLVTFDLPGPSLLAEGWFFELETEDGFLCESAAITAVIQTQPILASTLPDFPLQRIPCLDGVAGHIDRFVQAVIAEHGRKVAITCDQQFGLRPEKPRVSVLVPLYRRIDLMEHQIARISRDSLWANYELIYLLDSPEDLPEVKSRAAALAEFHRVPLRLVAVNLNAGFAAINNLGARLARAEILLFLNSDVLPITPAWIARMEATYQSIPKAGALGVKLLYEDGSIQHAGESYHANPDGFGWDCLPFFKHAHRDYAAANEARSVIAVTAACLMVSRVRFVEVGGFDEGYVQGDYEDMDLCLRLISTGCQNWYDPTIELYHLEGASYPSEQRRHNTLYNRWRHSQKWGAKIAELVHDSC
ncbi:glycosyltransferase family 2 protein [Oleiharenicola lentus]|uniref:glycosyltransferase family 2 protein n=1 Tax=Oleiharenicola lentus TaxID=2508720 RepID=UPI003F6611D6